ncbi:hypothetical protein XBO1_2390025 [Xenorhabdus bovienii str. oregonense]|uniref:Uncharacterized protein n=1 Tax=Xenorhabdus bovienii str. oregonense TaxID=1398202 RepID=A0A077NX21_XENBV|nr:hypothetical protein XBO1_2390025 [Xenorhabdus bovienii str. oregonense]
MVVSRLKTDNKQYLESRFIYPEVVILDPKVT